MNQPPQETASTRNGSYPPEQSGVFWQIAGVLYTNVVRIAVFTGLVAVLAVGVALVVPRDYVAEARVLKNEDTGMSSLLGLTARSAGGVSRLLAGSSAEYTRYLAILYSRSLREQLVEEFDLISAYGVGDAAHPLEAALRRLDRNLEVQVSATLDYMSIYAYDREPVRAARMANWMIDELNRRNAELTSESARQTRLFVEQRLSEARMDLDSARVAIQAFQERHGVVELSSQAETFIRGTAEQSGRVAQLEVQYQTLLGQYGPENPQVQAAQQALTSARAQERRALGGGQALLPVPLREMPALGRQYAELMQEQMIQTEVMQTIYPLYEQARFQERNEAQAVQVLDRAAIPVRPVRPKRSLIVVMAMLSGFVLACLFVLAQTWLRRYHTEAAHRLQSAAATARAVPGREVAERVSHRSPV